MDIRAQRPPQPQLPGDCSAKTPSFDAPCGLAMKIAHNNVVEFRYVLKDADGQTLESTNDDEPVRILHGHGNVLRGLENALTGREQGDSFSVTVAPEQAYGLRRPGWQERISKKHFPKSVRLKPGMEVTARTTSGYRQVTVVKVGAKVVDVDMNHPLAGTALYFDVEIIGVREANAEELAHGHAHGPQGHAH